ncbi:MAG: hypothetical protein KAG19_02215 [Methylococcales bacterium]|nr:hypothetical protein [Methylococcales bacterium]
MKHFIAVIFLTLLLAPQVHADGFGRLLSGVSQMRGNSFIKYSLVAGINNATVDMKRKNSQDKLYRIFKALSRALPKRIDRRTRYNKTAHRSRKVSIAESY